MLILGIVTALATLGVGPPDPAEVEAELRRAKNEYAYGNYDAAVQQLLALVYPMRLYNDEQVLEARRYLALAYYRLDKLDAAREEFGKLLYLDPDHELDPYTVPPAVVELLEHVRARMKPELDAIRQRQSDEKLGRGSKKGRVVTIEQTMIERSELGTLLPFGVGQFQNGDYRMGALFASLELTLLAANIGAYLWAASYGPTFSDRDIERRVQALTVVQYGALALFGVAWSLGVMHARAGFLPVVPGSRVVREQSAATSFAPQFWLDARF